MFGSNELIYVPGSPLPIMIEEEEEEELAEEEKEPKKTPTVPPRSKVSRKARAEGPSSVCELSLSGPASNDYEMLAPPSRTRNKPTLDNIAFSQSDQPPPLPPCPHTFPRTKKLKVDSDARLVSPPPRKYATIQRKEEAKSKSNVAVSFVFVDL